MLHYKNFFIDIREEEYPALAIGIGGDYFETSFVICFLFWTFAIGYHKNV